jgi:hypothetical protein
VRYDEEDPFIPVWEGPYLDAELVKLRLEEAHIPVDFGDALLPGHARVEVPRSYLGEVRDVISGNAATWPEVTEHGPSGVRVKASIQLGTKLTALLVIVLTIAIVLWAVVR